MDDITFIKNCASMGEMLLKNAAHSFGLDFGVINDTMIEIDKRAKKLGLTRKDLYPEEKNVKNNNG